ncbi:hypothetical protein ACHHYP_00487 [Achlya hypogyna]|uniref:Uncharacterized protein n=1 Tax=Achlya hypogyna TaxID=1202772 RepID=A0A1V9ZAM7_ACHHY|nr:hypothetical protein ACHHYP_00487 [Achlya hypogyna]
MPFIPKFPAMPTSLLSHLEAKLDALCSNLDYVPYGELSVVEKLLVDECIDDFDVENPVRLPVSCSALEAFHIDISRNMLVPMVSAIALASASLNSHLLTSSPTLCGDICPLQGGAKTQACVYYPAALTDFKCQQSSLGICVNTTEVGSAVKCLSNTWADHGSYEIGIRGATGSFGRSEPIREVQKYSAANVTELVLKNYNDAKVPLMLLDGAFSESSLSSLWIENVDLSLQRNIFPNDLKTLVLRKTGLRRIPKEVFTLSNLKRLEISGQFLDTSWLSKDEEAFVRRVNCTFG